MWCDKWMAMAACVATGWAATAWAMDPAMSMSMDPATMPNTATRPLHGESESAHHQPPSSLPATPALPEGMSLDDVLDRAAQPPPAEWPKMVPDDAFYAFLLVRQLEYRIGSDDSDRLGWRADAWAGYDYDKIGLKLEGEAGFDGPFTGESETDLLYSRLVTPFWYAQIGAQYANDWSDGDYNDRWSGVLALEGLAPGMFDIDTSLYVSQKADVTLKFEAEYDLRLTQRLVLQPRTELRFAAQDVEERDLGAGMTSADAEVRLRYEIKREFAPYIGVRYHRIVGESAGLARSAGVDPQQLFFVAGLRLAF